MTEQNKEQDFCAGLIGQAIPDVAGTEPSLRPIQGWILNSFEIQIRDLRRTAKRARSRFRPGSELHSIHQPDMEAYAAACDAAADVFSVRMNDQVGSGNDASEAERAVTTRRSAAQKD